MSFPGNLRYTKDHEWVSIDGDVGTVGITDYAQGELGDVVFVELPAVGKAVKQHETFGTIEAVKAVSDLYVPLSGTVTEVNKELETQSEVVNKDPYGKGWMIRIKLSQPDEVKGLLSAEAYKAIVAK
jgi:glycine cleavage system H protein